MSRDEFIDPRISSSSSSLPILKDTFHGVGDESRSVLVSPGTYFHLPSMRVSIPSALASISDYCVKMIGDKDDTQRTKNFTHVPFNDLPNGCNYAGAYAVHSIEALPGECDERLRRDGRETVAFTFLVCGGSCITWAFESNTTDRTPIPMVGDLKCYRKRKYGDNVTYWGDDQQGSAIEKALRVEKLPPSSDYFDLLPVMKKIVRSWDVPTFGFNL